MHTIYKVHFLTHTHTHTQTHCTTGLLPAYFSLETLNHFNSLIGVTVLLSFSLMCLTIRW
ncbi:hypothetical protein NP493_1018g00000 [Ridgeia piscesae]|uniref:Uncharacterized protein n=1 Tax=Ridgeia piscesae TaxID=27915 RepID=A0AAD9NKE5_RIDPI|nr:hypothetical protein NP493_1018g00000 [Ridgeia piscesae]